MSIRAINWAWQKDLKPTPKLILMALADAADDEGICWPSIQAVAAKCSVSDRTVQRAMRMFTACRLMAADERYRPNGSRTSNRYRLLLEGGDKLSPTPDSNDTAPRQGCQPPPDTCVTPRTTTEPKKESPLPLLEEVASIVSISVESGGGKLLIYPKNASSEKFVGCFRNG